VKAVYCFFYCGIHVVSCPASCCLSNPVTYVRRLLPSWLLLRTVRRPEPRTQHIKLLAALQFVCPDQVWTPHMLQGLPIEVKPVVGAARRAFCSLLRAHTSLPAADLCPKRHACKYNTGAGQQRGWAYRAAYACIRACLCPAGPQAGPGPGPLVGQGRLWARAALLSLRLSKPAA
jgi:hypothetical protein